MKAKAFRTIPRILRINYRSGYVVSCLFSNGEHRAIDFGRLFGDILKPKAGSPASTLMQDEAAFGQVKLEGMNLRWDNVGLQSTNENGEPVFYPFELDPLVLYQNSQPDPTATLDLAKLIREMRLSMGLSQTELAEKSGTTKQYISKIENQRSDIEFRTLKRIVEAGLGKRLVLTIE